SLGCSLVLLAVLSVSQRLKYNMAILRIALMFGSVTWTIVRVWTYFRSAEQHKKFTLWCLGNLGNQSWNSIGILTFCSVIGFLLSFLCVKPLNALLLGENYAKSIGVNFDKTKTIIILATSIMAGSATAFAGPIAFIGLAVPH